MELSIKLSNKSKLQNGLDRDLENEPCGCAVEEALTESKQEKNLALFEKPKKKAVFQVDLLSGWVKP